MLSPQAILDRLGRRFDLLVAGSRDQPSRQRSLRAAIDWSWDLLPPEQRTLLRRLAVFAGGAGLEAAEEVCGRSGGAPVLNGLEALVDQGLLISVTDPEGRPRVRMLETIREYALEGLGASGELDAVRRRHAAFFLGLAEAAAPELWGARQLTWFERLERDHNNMRAALQWSLAADPTTGLRLAWALARFWFERGYAAEARGWVTALLGRPETRERSAARARALLFAAALARLFGDDDAARGHVDEGLAISRELGDRVNTAEALLEVAYQLHQRSDLDQADEVVRSAIALWRDLADPQHVAQAMNLDGEVARSRGDLDRAAASYEESLALARAAGDVLGVGARLHNLAHVALLRADHARATDLFRESLRIARDVGSPNIAMLCVAGLAAVAVAAGTPQTAARAVRLFGIAEAMRETSGWLMSPPDRAVYDRNVALARARLGSSAFAAVLADARAMTHDEALDYASETRTEWPAAALAPTAARPPDRTPLTAREQEVAALVARGFTNQQIAGELRIASGTARAHLEHILAKLGLHSRAQVAAWAVQRGLAVEPSA